MMYVSTGERCGTTSSEDGEQEPPCETITGWELFWVLYSAVGFVSPVLMASLPPNEVSDVFMVYALPGEELWESCKFMYTLLWWVVCGALWPIWAVPYFGLSLWRITAARIDGIRNVILERHTRDQRNEAANTSRTDNSSWHRRGWLVLLRTRHQRIAAASVSSRGRWTGCFKKQNGLAMLVLSLPREEDALESGQGSVAKDIAALRFRTLLMRVVEHEEDGVFRSIVGYL